MRVTRTVGMLLLLLCCMGSVLAQQPFTYQGMLKKSGVPANGSYDFQFSLWTANSGGSQIGSTITRAGVNVSNGLFTTELDFGAVWNGGERYLQIAVRPSGSGSYTTLSPRVKVNPAPYANTATLLNIFQSGTTNPDRMVITHSPAYPNWGLQYQDVGDKFNFLSEGTPVMTIDLGMRRVGIGTSDPVYGALQVETNSNTAAIWARQTGTGDFIYAIRGRSESPSGRGVIGEATGGNGIGVIGASLATAGNPAGVYGTSASPNGVGVLGRISPERDPLLSAGNAGVWGDVLFTDGVNFGGFFRVLSPSGHGVRALNESTDRQTEARLATYYDPLFTGESNLSAGGAGFGRIGLYGRSTTGEGTGVMGESENWKGVGGWTRRGFGVAGHQMGADNSGVGVWGRAEGATGVGVLAQNTQNGPALEIRGQIVVPDAHSATDTPVFKHTATSGNTSGNVTTINHPMCNDDPNAMLIVTHDWGTSGPYVTKPFGVWYNSGVGRWTIFIEDGSAMPLGAKFNVLVIKTRGGGFLSAETPPLTPTTIRSDER